MLNKVTVLGAGVWGSVIARHMHNLGMKVSVWEYSKDLLDTIKANGGTHPNIPNFKFDETYTLTNDLKTAVEGADLLVFVFSSKAVRSVCQQLKTILNGKAMPVLNATKGLEDQTFKTMSEIIEEELPAFKNKVVAFSGPSFALEVARGIPTKITLAGYDEDLLKELQNKLTKKPLCFELSKDRRGAEYGGAIKNVVAIGCGILDGIGEGANTKAALLTEAMQEMSIIMLSQGCTQYAVYSLCGLGDAILTGMSAISRNRRLGEKLGQGLDLEEAKKQVGTIAEGLNSVQSVHDIINKNNLNCPVINAIWEIVVQGKKANTLLKALGFKDE
ncbi:MAG: NAD(P)H-dependent glycerol-3-phosphate dehydrogenase [Elusimicrobiaceae bacterium]|nr:NAD(P)H-dependent glycerol-3-phosphate dehydrogenase [Elusimicrobiaceae bacterium]